MANSFIHFFPGVACIRSMETKVSHRRGSRVLEALCENSTSTSVLLSTRGHWERFSFKVFQGEHRLCLGFLVNND